MQAWKRCDWSSCRVVPLGNSVVTLGFLDGVMLGNCDIGRVGYIGPRDAGRNERGNCSSSPQAQFHCWNRYVVSGADDRWLDRPLEPSRAGDRELNLWIAKNAAHNPVFACRSFGISIGSQLKIHLEILNAISPEVVC